MTTLADLMTEPPRTRWGRWEVTADGEALRILDGTTPRYVPLERCTTDAGRWLWTRHYAGKGWTTPADVFDLVAALADLAERRP